MELQKSLRFGTYYSHEVKEFSKLVFFNVKGNIDRFKDIMNLVKYK